MSAFRRKVAELIGIPEESMSRLAGGDLSEVLLFTRPDGRRTVAKGGPAVGTEAAMLRSIGGLAVPAPTIEAEHDGVLLLEHVPNDGVFSPNAWAAIGAALRRLHHHTHGLYGWPVDFQLATVAIDNRQGEDWPYFWSEQRLLATAAMLDRPWRERVERLAARIRELLPPQPAAAHLHGDLWTGNILVREGRLAALIDPACYHGHAEVDLAMLTLFDEPAPEFWDAYGGLEPGWRERRALYQLWPALVHLRLFGQAYAGMADRLLRACSA